MKEQLEFLPGLRFACSCCGRCCQQWGIEVSAAEKERLEKLDWSKVPEAPPREQFFRDLGKPSQPRWMMGLQPSGFCRFLGSDKLCLIHKHFGAEAKPVPCQRFPYHFVRTPTGVYTSLSYVSDGARRNLGAELSESRDELTAFYERVGADREHGASVALSAAKQASWADYLALENRVRAVITSAPTGRFWTALFEGERLLAEAAGETVPQSDPLPMAELKLRHRVILGLCIQVFLRTKLVDLSNADVSTYVEAIVLPALQRRLQLDNRTFTFAEISTLPKVTLDAPAETMLRRFMEQSLFGKAFFGRWGDEQVSVLAGYRLLMLQCVLTVLWIRLHPGSNTASETSEALMITCRNLQHRVGLGSWIFSAERLATEMRALILRIAPPE